jgi:hypothetical protein
VIDANTLVTHVFRSPGENDYRTKFEAGPDQEVVSTRAPAVTMCLAALGLKPL